MKLALLLVLVACKGEPPPPAPGSGSQAPARKFGVVADLPGTPALVAGSRTFALHGDDRWYEVKAGALVENRAVAAAIASEADVTNVLYGTLPVIVAGEEHHERHLRLTPSPSEVILPGLALKIVTTKLGLEGWLYTHELATELALAQGGEIAMTKFPDRTGPLPENLSPVRAKLCEHPQILDVAASDTSVFALVGECNETVPLRLFEYAKQDADPIVRELAVTDLSDEKLVVSPAGKATVAGIRAGKLVPGDVAASRLLAALASGDSVWALVVDPSGKHTVVRDGTPVSVDLAPSAIGYDETLGAVILATDGKRSRVYAERVLTR